MTLALAFSTDFIIRPAAEDDLNYVRKTWLQEHAQHSDWIDAVGGGKVYFQEHAKFRDAAIRRGAVTVACRPSVVSGVCGFAVTERMGELDVLHFVYVKPRWGRLGVAKFLLAPLLDKPVIYTHETNLIHSLPIPEAWTFNPYLFLRTP